MTMQVEGIEQLQRNMRQLADEIGEAMAGALVAGGNDVRNTAIRSIQSVSGGSEVTRSRNGGNTYQHTAAGPGQAPNTDTGRLVNSIQVEVDGGSVFVGSTLEYAGWLEHGTRRMAARPWLNPALEANRKNINDRVRDAVGTTIKRKGDL